jgi:hypothetical protein
VTAVGREVEQLGTAVLLRGLAVKRLYLLAHAGLDSATAAGVPERLCRELLDAMRAATAEQHVGRDHVRSSTRRPELSRDQYIGTAEAAKLLGVGERHVRRLAPQLGRRRGGCWHLDRAAVQAVADLRKDR